VLAEFRPKLIDSQARRVEAESQSKAEFNNDRTSRMQLGEVKWGRRPTSPDFTYCGLDEFAGTYAIPEVKNLDLSCGKFSPKEPDAAPRACSSCKHLRPPLDGLVRTLEETLQRRGQKGQQLLDGEIAPMLRSQAESEYGECVDGTGVVSKPPIFLPLCHAHSSPGDSRYIVGPIVNASSRCPRWEADDGSSAARADPKLEAIAAQTRQIVGAWESDFSGALTHYDVDMQRASDAEADLVDYCLATMGWEREFVVSFAGRFAQTCWGKQWTEPSSRQSTSAAPGVPPAGQPAPTAAIQEPAPPQASPMPTVMPLATTPAPAVQPAPTSFLVQPNVPYQHPGRPDLTLTVVPYPMQTIAVVTAAGASIPYDLAACPPGQWTQLQTPAGPLPIALLVQLPFAVYAAWG
jgi:hypothetical protein